MSSTQVLLNFTEKIEGKNIVSKEVAIKIKKFIHKLESASSWELFLIISGIMGSLFASAGVFAIISHNWDDFSKHVRGGLSLIPVLTGLFFYYLAVFKHQKSKAWIEATSMLLMLMIGASMSLISQTYQMDGDFNKFIKVWAFLTLPMFYLGRSSGIALIYLGLISFLAIDFSIGMWGIPNFGHNENLYWFWFFLIGFLPHYYMALNKKSKRQSIRVVYLSYCLFIVVIVGVAFTIKSNFILWYALISLVFYLLGKKYMGNNSSIFGRPFQLFSQLAFSWILLVLSNKDAVRFVLREDSFLNLSIWDTVEKINFFSLIALMLVTYFVFFKFNKSFENASYFVVFTPVLLIISFLMVHYFETGWALAIIMNLYILLMGFGAMITGSGKGNVSQMAYGLILISILLWVRYFDTDWNFIVKGIVFLLVGGLFFLINFLVKGKVEEIENYKSVEDED